MTRFSFQLLRMYTSGAMDPDSLSSLVYRALLPSYAQCMIYPAGVSGSSNRPSFSSLRLASSRAHVCILLRVSVPLQYGTSTVTYEVSSFMV